MRTLAVTLTVVLLAGSALAETFSNGTLRGSYAMRLEPLPSGSDSAGSKKQHSLRGLGILTFDGAGHVSGSRILRVYDPTGNRQTALCCDGTIAGEETVTHQTLSGTYMVAPDGTGTMIWTVTPPVEWSASPNNPKVAEPVESVDFVLVEDGQSVLLDVMVSATSSWPSAGAVVPFHAYMEGQATRQSTPCEVALAPALRLRR